VDESAGMDKSLKINPCFREGITWLTSKVNQVGPLFRYKIGLILKCWFYVGKKTLEVRETTNNQHISHDSESAGNKLNPGGHIGGRQAL
jgi:hypothetical protein